MGCEFSILCSDWLDAIPELNSLCSIKNVSWICNSHSGNYKESYYLGYDAV